MFEVEFREIQFPEICVIECIMFFSEHHLCACSVVTPAISRRALSGFSSQSPGSLTYRYGNCVRFSDTGSNVLSSMTILVFSHQLSCSLFNSRVLSSTLMYSHRLSCSLFNSRVLSSILMFSLQLSSCSLFNSRVLSSTLMYSHQLSCSLFNSHVLSPTLMFSQLSCTLSTFLLV